MKLFRGFIAFLLALILLFTTVPVSAQPQHHNKVKNIIFMIPDGFSTDYATTYRIYKGDSEPVWDQYLVGMVKTRSANNWVTDSAAAATALATGVKTNNDMIGMTPNGKQLRSILQAARDKGKATGLVATLSITHATPAAFAASTESRANKDVIARQLLENEVNVLLGGGRRDFLPRSENGRQGQRNLIEEAKEKGYHVIFHRDELKSVKGEKVLGLFAHAYLAPELDRNVVEEPSLVEMTTTAIDVLSQDDDGFFLMVEGSQIDQAGHVHDAAWAMKDAEAFEEAVAHALNFAQEDGNTLVVIVGDHDTGGLSVGGYNKYESKVEILRNVTATGKYMAKLLNDERSNAKEILRKYANIKLTRDEFRRIKEVRNPAFEINSIISERAVVGWTSRVHTGEDVPLYAFGLGTSRFRGILDNTDVPKIMAELMNVELNNE